MLLFVQKILQVSGTGSNELHVTFQANLFVCLFRKRRCCYAGCCSAISVRSLSPAVRNLSWRTWGRKFSNWICPTMFFAFNCRYSTLNCPRMIKRIWEVWTFASACLTRLTNVSAGLVRCFFAKAERCMWNLWFDFSVDAHVDYPFREPF